MERQSKIIRTVLSPALRLWLRSQVESIETLEVDIEGGDRQILSGQIPGLRVSATQAVYQGLHLSELELAGGMIRVNLGQVLRGQPLQLLEPIPVQAKVGLRVEDLNASLSSPLLLPLIQDWLQALALLLVGAAGDGGSLEVPTGRIEQPNFGLVPEGIQLQGLWLEDHAKPQPLLLQAKLQLEGGRRLGVRSLHWLQAPPQGLMAELNSLVIPALELGEEVCLEGLTLTSERLHCWGRLQVNPY